MQRAIYLLTETLMILAELTLPEQSALVASYWPIPQQFLCEMVGEVFENFTNKTKIKNTSNLLMKTQVIT